LTWSDGEDDGGSPIIDYRILYSIGSGDFTVLRYGINSNSFVATGLNTGTTYKFKVQARNAQGYSDFSIDQVIQTAEKPEKPATPLTSFNPDAITIQWT
jgi:Fibronectin type III domain